MSTPADAYPLQEPHYVATDVIGRKWRFEPLRLADRGKINNALRAIYPHPLTHIADLLPKLDTESKKQVIELAMSQVEETGWPVTLDVPLGRLLALRHADTVALLGQLSLRGHGLSLDEAKTVMYSMSEHETERAIECMFELRPFEGVTDPEDESDPKATAVSEPPSPTA